jgi:hypothetical protein
MDRHLTLFPYNNQDTTDHCFLISNRSDDVLGIVNLRCYEKGFIPDLQTLVGGLSANELRSIVSEFVRVCEKDAEYDKVGQSYYAAKNWLKNHSV